MLSWEYPPRIVGGIARHVEELSWSLAKSEELEVHVVTCEFPGAPAEEVYNGVHIHRVQPHGSNHADFFHWVHQLNAALRDRAKLLVDGWLKPKTKRSKTPETKKLNHNDGIIIHAHDWLAHFAAVELKHHYKLPMVATIHATEFGRNNGIHTDVNRYINSIEWQLSHEAWRVVVCSHYMRGEVGYALHTPWDKVDIIYNGVSTEKFDFDFPPPEAAAFRQDYARANEKIVMFVGRGVREKGCQVLIEAFPIVRAHYHDAKLVVAGGGQRLHLIEQAQWMGISKQSLFTGFIPDDDLLRLYKVADVACFPSLYEPFGIVALEAMAAKTPVVVSDAGGLPEVVEAGISGTVTLCNNPESLAHGIIRVLKDPGYARYMAENARERVGTLFNWDTIAQQTEHVYNRVWTEFRACDW
jgi:glycosyltransferase involved in cell wall biosynthesis